MATLIPNCTDCPQNIFYPFPFNLTLYNNPNLCTFQTCPRDWAASQYLPSLAGNAVYAVIFGLCLIVQIYFGIRYRTWGYMSGMIGGCTLETIGYAGRIMIHEHQFDGNAFLIQICCLTIAPACFTLSIYLCLSRLVIAFGEKLSRFSPKMYTLFFVICDVLSLTVQAAGGVTTSMSDGNSSTQNAAVNVMVAGIAFQVVSLAVFMAACIEFYWRVKRASKAELNPKFEHIRNTTRFRLFPWTLTIATLAIFVRSVFRCAELKNGFQGPLANNQVTFMVLEGAMVVTACLALTILHPGTVFGAAWHDAHWHLNKKKAARKAREREEREKGAEVTVGEEGE